MILSFTWGGYRMLKKINKTDYVVAVLPYFTTAWLGGILKKRFGAKFWIHVQDFEFDIVKQLAVSRSGGLKTWVFKGLFALEKNLFDSADCVSTISYGMLEKLKQKTVSPTYYFPNWIDLSAFKKEDYEKHEYIKSDKFNILYAGTIGQKQDWDFFLNVAKELDPAKYEIVLVGSGARKSFLERNIKEMENVNLCEPVPFEELPQLLSSADAHFLFQKTDVIDTVMPSKLLGMMASGKPSLVLGNSASEVKIVFSDACAGIFFTEPDVSAAIRAFEHFYDQKGSGQGGYARARDFVFKNFGDTFILKNWEEALERC